MAKLRDLQVELEFARCAFPGACSEIPLFEEAGIGLLRKITDGNAERLFIHQVV
jgi:hypothetical protein